MDNEKMKEGGEAGGAKTLSGEQQNVQAEQEPKPKSNEPKPGEDEYASDVSESIEVIRNEFKDMYEENEYEEEEEEEEEEGEEEETSEEEDLSEYKLQLEEKYMKGIEFNEEYLAKENKKIEDVPLQLYAIETYINSVRTFYGFSNHWIRLKVFDSPCFEIQPCNKVYTHASLYANRSMAQSKGSVYGEKGNLSKMDLVQTEIMSQEQKRMGNKRLDIDMSKMNEKERRKTMDLLMHEEVTRAGTVVVTKSKLQIHSTEKNVGLDIPILELLDEEDKEKILPDERRESKTWILREPIENGKTIMFPKRPAEFIHQLQRQPLKLFVLSTSGLLSAGQLELSGLTEAVIRASKGPPYPISSMQRFHTLTTGDFTAKVVGTIRVIAIGPRNLATIKCEDNVNESEVSRPPRRPKAPIIVHSMDSQEDKPSILTGPQKFTLYDIVKNIRERRLKEKHKPPPKPAPKRYYVDDLVFNRAKNTVNRAPKKTYVSLKAEIDRYLVLNKKKDKPLGSMVEEESVRSSIDDVEDERSLGDDEGEEEYEMGDEREERFEPEIMTHRVEAVFQSLIQVYGQNWANYKPQSSPISSTSMGNERMPKKVDDSKSSFSSSSNWQRFGSNNTEQKKH
ncbi:uncharacterized protein [Halyomorpha halys]|uniref:uncharacterized protein n=1 Tax=Halyomorpha halys TaxID=286706 RepID=UPI0006D50DD2|nr:uncharacterized protein LOC106690348 [Halyomorpha halys]